MSKFYEKAKPQGFTKFDKQFKYNELTKLLEELDDDLDVDAFVQSSADTALTAVLDRFLPDYNVLPATFDLSRFPTDENGCVDMSVVQSDLDELLNMSAVLEEIKYAYDMPDSFTIKNVYDFLSKKIGGLNNENHEKKETKQEAQQEDVLETISESPQA